MRRLTRHRGFSFAEVMFAVVILGIGFIMIAAFFPVAIQQSLTNADESNAAAFARQVVSTIAGVSRAADYTGTDSNATQAFVSIPAPSQLYDRIISSLLNPSDPRYAAVPYYSKIDDGGTVRVTVVVVRRANRTVYTIDDLNASGSQLVPKNVTINSVQRDGDGSISVAIAKDPAGNYAAAAPGSFLVVLSASTAVGGKTLRLGEMRSETDQIQTWGLTPETALEATDDYTNTSAALIGREFVDPNNASAGFTGPAQDVAVYTTFIRPG